MATRNVLLITVDSLRADATGITWNDQPVTPQLDAVADSGATFGEAVANGSNTPSSFPSILTSTYPLMYGGYSYLDERRPFVAEQFERAGYETVGYHSNPHLGPDMNYDRGFQRFNDRGERDEQTDVSLLNKLKYTVEDRLDPNSALYSVLRRGWHYLTMSTDTAAYADATKITESALDWLERWDSDENGPFFMWLHYMDVHYPFMPPEEHLNALNVDPPSKRRIARLNGKMHENSDELSEVDRADLLDLYHGEVRYTDHEIGRVIDLLSELGQLEASTIAVTADHGEAFGEHGRYGHHPYLYDELLRVPLVLTGPNVSAGVDIESQVSLIDLGPTLCDLSDVNKSDKFCGNSLAPLIHPSGGTLDEQTAICTAAGGDMLACRTKEWKCFWNIDEDRVELYNLERDPEETTDVSKQHPEVVGDFRKRLEAHLTEADQTDVELSDVTISSATKQRLRNLGYK